MIDRDYAQVLAGLKVRIDEFPAIAPEEALPVISGDKAIEDALVTLISHFENCKTKSFSNAVTILGKAIGVSSGDNQNDDSELSSDSPLRNRLIALQTVTQSAKPINDCISEISRLKTFVESRRKEENHIDNYSDTVDALESVQSLGELATQQGSDLQVRLKKSTEKWTNSVYRNAYARSGHALADTTVAPEGALSISVGSNGAVAPAQHVSNASALRACLLGFYIAFWEHVLKTRGGAVNALMTPKSC
ncbi:MAG: hypothetical protein V3T17_09520 [Pseudomonadales bacterium]